MSLKDIRFLKVVKWWFVVHLILEYAGYHFKFNHHFSFLRPVWEWCSSTNGKYHSYWFITYTFWLNWTYLVYILWFTKHELLVYLTSYFDYFFLNSDVYNLRKTQKHQNFVDAFSKVAYTNTLFFSLQCFDYYWYNRKYYRWSVRSYYNYAIGYFLNEDRRIIPFFGENFHPTEYLDLIMVCSAVLFVLSTFISFFKMSYLGLQGVFSLNIKTLVFFWLMTLTRIQFYFFEGNSCTFNFGKWFTLFGHSNILFEFYIDSVSFAYILLTLTIAVFVFIYTFSYFRYEPNVERLLLLINFFVISMIILVSSGNLFVLFLGWELIGLSSFLLINFWSTRISTLKAAFKAFVFNKFSDVSLLIAILLLFGLTQESNILIVLTQVSSYSNVVLDLGFTNVSFIELVSFFLLLAAFIKSAQFGPHIWLPDSMEAPAPASALIHSATLVSAGVFLVLRFSPLFELSLYSYFILALVGSFTAFFGGVCAAYQSDIKRILAYSTISHCGFLMLSCSTRVPELTIFYLYVHGFFKAAVFLCVGSIIRFSLNYQDFRKMGNYWKFLPFECSCSLICLLNLAGLPFTLGFFIKHVLFALLDKHFFFCNLIFGFVLIASIAGLFYSYRIYNYIFFDFSKASKHTYYEASRVDLKSVYYSNTTKASNWSIFFLLFFGYIISIYLYFLILDKCTCSEAFDIVTIHSSNFYKFNWSFTPLLTFLSLYNWFVIQIVVMLIYSIWRYVHFYASVLSFLTSLTIFCVIVYFNFSIFGFIFIE